MRFGHVARDSYRICCVARKAARTCRKGFDYDLRRQAKHLRPSPAPSKRSVSAAVFFGSESPLNPTVARCSWNSQGLPELESSLARCSRCDYQRRHLRARGVLREWSNQPSHGVPLGCATKVINLAQPRLSRGLDIPTLRQGKDVPFGGHSGQTLPAVASIAIGPTSEKPGTTPGGTGRAGRG